MDTERYRPTWRSPERIEYQQEEEEDEIRTAMKDSLKNDNEMNAIENEQTKMIDDVIISGSLNLTQMN